MAGPIYNPALKTALYAEGQTKAGLLKALIEDGGTNASDGHTIVYNGGSGKFVSQAVASAADMDVVEKTSSYSVQSSDAGDLLVGNHATVAIAFTLPDPSTVANKRFYFNQNGAAAVTLTRNGSEKIMGSAADYVMVRNETISLVSDGTNWIGV
jgi:hypothetical protein